MAVFYGYETAGIFQTDEEATANMAQPEAEAGDVIFVDQNEDGVLDENDKTVIGNPHPDFTYGLTRQREVEELRLRACSFRAHKATTCSTASSVTT